ncbi:MAG: tyrosine-type recombinase/integrase [Bacteroidales bacterium]|nr:tyrosine-type recombinase/integrase [Bacteroidales bacterium]
MNNITSPELLSQVNPDNMQLLRDFKDYLHSIQRSETTIAGYESDILIAFVWCLEYNENKFFVDWTKRNIVAFQNYLLSENENSPARIRRIKSSLSSMSNFIELVLDDEYPNFRNIINKVENPANHPVREKTVWEDSELEGLLDLLVERKDYEKACYLALAMYSGRRKSELCRFKVSDFDDSKLVCDGALYKSSPIKTKGRGEGKVIPCYTLAKRFKPYLDLWMEDRKRDGIESEWLFPDPSNPNEPVKISTINSWSNTFTRLSGKEAYIHSLRHYFTTCLAKAGIPDSVIQSIVSWESSDMVRLYTDLDVDEQIGMYFKDGDIAVPEKKGFTDL